MEKLTWGKSTRCLHAKTSALSGFIRTKANFRGKQSDAKNGRYDLLNNAGTMDVKDLTITHELFPKPFFIRQGHFRFDRDKMWFETFQANYGKSDLQLDGFVENAINYVLAKNEILNANFNLKSKTIDLNEFTVYASSTSSPSARSSSSESSRASSSPSARSSTSESSVHLHRRLPGHLHLNPPVHLHRHLPSHLHLHPPCICIAICQVIFIRIYQDL